MPYFQCGITVESILAYTHGLTQYLYLWQIHVNGNLK